MMTNDEVKQYETVTTLAAQTAGISTAFLRSRYVYDQEHDRWDRVRRDQVKDQHTHFWCDRRQRWIDHEDLAVGIGVNTRWTTPTQTIEASRI